MQTKEKWDPKTYNQRPNPPLILAQQLLRDTTFSDESNLCVLGCRTGSICTFLAQIAPNTSIVGLDNDPAMVRQACIKQESNVNYCLSNGANLASEFSEHFDAIVALYELHWYPYDQQAEIIKQCAQSLKTGGSLFIGMTQKGELHPIFQACNDTVQLSKWRELVGQVCIDACYFPQTKSALEKNVQESGLEIKKSELQSSAQQSDAARTVSDQEYKQFILGTLGKHPQIVRLLPEKRDKLLADIIAMYKQKFVDIPASFTRTMLVLQAYKQKK